MIGGSRIYSITFITQDTPLTFTLFQISLGDTSINKKTYDKQGKSETYDYTQWNQPTVCVNNSSKLKVREYARSLIKFIYLDMDFSDHTDQRINDLSFDIKT